MDFNLCKIREKKKVCLGGKYSKEKNILSYEKFISTNFMGEKNNLIKQENNK